MFSSGCNYNKLKANLQLATQRLKLLEKKKTEMAIKSRREIADYLAANKPDRARIRVENIIREENTVEAMELLEMFCDLLVARAGLMKAQASVDPGLEEAVCSLIWAAPRMEAEVQELKAIAEQLRYKYGREYFEAAACNSLQKVNPKLLKKMAVEAPEKRIVELYLVEIARSFNVPFTPDQSAIAVPSAPVVIDGVVLPVGMLQPMQPHPDEPPLVMPAIPTQPTQPLPPTQPSQFPPPPVQPGPFPPPPNVPYGSASTPQHPPSKYPPPIGPHPPSDNAGGGMPAHFQPNYPGSASAPLYTTLPPPYQPSDGKGMPPGWANASNESSSSSKPPLPTDAVNPPSAGYPSEGAGSDFNYAGMPTLPSGQHSPPPPPGGASGQQPPPRNDASLDDLERRFEDLRRKI